ncbi:hypothetical protein BT69DRAFT_1184935, partial [Atractiella rhizophila]
FSSNETLVALIRFLASFFGVLGLAFSILIRIELSSPGSQILIGNHQLFNAIITAHAILIFFFMVNLMLFKEISKYLNCKSQNVYPYIGNNIYGDQPPHPHNTIIIDKPYYNRKVIIQHGKGMSGVYVFTDRVTGAIYVGGATNLYYRVSSYFMPSIIGSGKRRVYRYFKKYGYNNLELTLHILPVGSTPTQVTQLEQFYIDIL